MVQKRIRWINQVTGKLMNESNYHPKERVIMGAHISPFATPQGRVNWYVQYVEDLNEELMNVYVIDNGFVNPENFK